MQASLDHSFDSSFRLFNSLSIIFSSFCTCGFRFSCSCSFANRFSSNFRQWICSIHHSAHSYCHVFAKSHFGSQLASSCCRGQQLFSFFENLQARSHLLQNVTLISAHQAFWKSGFQGNPSVNFFQNSGTAFRHHLKFRLLHSSIPVPFDCSRLAASPGFGLMLNASIFVLFCLETSIRHFRCAVQEGSCSCLLLIVCCLVQSLLATIVCVSFFSARPSFICKRLRGTAGGHHFARASRDGKVPGSISSGDIFFFLV